MLRLRGSRTGRASSRAFHAVASLSTWQNETPCGRRGQTVPDFRRDDRLSCFCDSRLPNFLKRAPDRRRTRRGFGCVFHFSNGNDYDYEKKVFIIPTVAVRLRRQIDEPGRTRATHSGDVFSRERFPVVYHYNELLAGPGSAWCTLSPTALGERHAGGSGTGKSGSGSDYGDHRQPSGPVA